MYQDMKVSGHVFVCMRYWFCLFLQFLFWILELFLQLATFCFFTLSLDLSLSKSVNM